MRAIISFSLAYLKCSRLYWQILPYQPHWVRLTFSITMTISAFITTRLGILTIFIQLSPIFSCWIFAMVYQHRMEPQKSLYPAKCHYCIQMDHIWCSQTRQCALSFSPTLLRLHTATSYVIRSFPKPIVSSLKIYYKHNPILSMVLWATYWRVF